MGGASGERSCRPIARYPGAPAVTPTRFGSAWDVHGTPTTRRLTDGKTLQIPTPISRRAPVLDRSAQGARREPRLDQPPQRRLAQPPTALVAVHHQRDELRLEPEQVGAPREPVLDDPMSGHPRQHTGQRGRVHGGENMPRHGPVCRWRSARRRVWRQTRSKLLRRRYPAARRHGSCGARLAWRSPLFRARHADASCWGGNRAS